MCAVSKEDTEAGWKAATYQYCVIHNGDMLAKFELKDITLM